MKTNQSQRITIQYCHPKLTKGKWYTIKGEHKDQHGAESAIVYKQSMFDSSMQFRVSSFPEKIYFGLR